MPTQEKKATKTQNQKSKRIYPQSNYRTADSNLTSKIRKSGNWRHKSDYWWLGWGDL